jgi:hypothetical protein
VAEPDRPLLDVLGERRQGESEADGDGGEVERAAT